MLLELTVEDYLKALDHIKSDYYDGLPQAFTEQISCSWFEEVAPIKAPMYGTECWLRLGYMGLIAELSACHYRWRTLMTHGHPVDDPAMFNALRDTFGYSVMMRVYLGIPRMRWSYLQAICKDRSPVLLHENLLTFWDTALKGQDQPTDSLPMWGTALAVAQWRHTAR